jgi:hypothetical protein
MFGLMLFTETGEKAGKERPVLISKGVPFET